MGEEAGGILAWCRVEARKRNGNHNFIYGKIIKAGQSLVL
jgi:hypothetical protein